MGKLRRPKRHRKHVTTSIVVRKKEVDLKPEDCDTQPLPRKLRLLMNTTAHKPTIVKSSKVVQQHKGVEKSSDVHTDEEDLHTQLQTSPSVRNATSARKRHLKKWKEKHKKRQQKRREISSHDHKDKVRFGEVVCRPPELSTKRVKLQHLSFAKIAHMHSQFRARDNY